MLEFMTIGDVCILHMSMTSQFVDIFMKCLSTLVFSEFKSSINIHSG
jgi:hypothetical protein